MEPGTCPGARGQCDQEVVVVGAVLIRNARREAGRFRAAADQVLADHPQA